MKKIIFILIFILAFSGIALAEQTPIKLYHALNDSNSGTVFFYTLQEEFKKSATFEVNDNSPLKLYISTMSSDNNSLSYSAIWVMETGEREIFLNSSIGIIPNNKFDYHTKNVIASTNNLLNTIKNSY